MWKEADARMAADEVLGRAGIDVPYLDLLRFGENALYAFPEKGLVVRVARPETPPARVRRTLEFVTRLAAAGMAVAEPVAFPGVVQPAATSTGVVSLWTYYDVDPGCRVTAEELGTILRRFHDLAGPLADLVGRWEPFGLIRARLAAAHRDGIPAALVDPLDAILADLEETVPNLTTELGRGVIHGDTHYGNVLCLPGHRLLLIDFDQVAVGPREWDLVPTLVTHRRLGMSEANYERFCAAYGYDLRTSPQVSTLVALRELGMVSWLLQQYGTRADVDAEIELRIGSISEKGPDLTSWRAF